MRPRIKPALRRLDRDGRTVQFGAHPLHAVMLTGVEPAVRKLLDSLDGTRTLAEITAGCRGLDQAATHRLIDLLTRHGLLDDASIRRDVLHDMTIAERDRLGPDLGELSLSRHAIDGGLGAMRRRRLAHVRVYGAGRVGAQM
ncbi:MAG TPA: thiamine biosynthesis protein ThiF, partial [Thermopolyspora sp.]